ncbi:MAG: hypothetical protein L6Q83_00495 [Gammaproteobacteria bacterium]|nr:hypothetical protein [Gammaproteobacteria bacterium]
MTRNELLEVRLELANPGELFRAPEADPLAGQLHEDSGLQRILNQLRQRPRRAVRATIILPASARSADLESRCRSTLQQYCALRITQIGNDRGSLRQEGLATLWRGLLFLALCLSAMNLVGEPRFLPPRIAYFIYEGLVIAGWVALWYPLDVLLYQGWPLAREQRLYAALAAMELRFEFVG